MRALDQQEVAAEAVYLQSINGVLVNARVANVASFELKNLGA